jgi:class 3 adenylate cyclase
MEPKIREYLGRIVKHIGDGALVEFGSAVDAVRCALDVQRAMMARNAVIRFRQSLCHGIADWKRFRSDARPDAWAGSPVSARALEASPTKSLVC